MAYGISSLTYTDTFSSAFYDVFISKTTNEYLAQSFDVSSSFLIFLVGVLDAGVVAVHAEVAVAAFLDVVNLLEEAAPLPGFRLVDGFRSKTFSTLSAWNPQRMASLDKMSSWHCKSCSSSSNSLSAEIIWEHSDWICSIVPTIVVVGVLIPVLSSSILQLLFVTPAEDDDGSGSGAVLLLGFVVEGIFMMMTDFAQSSTSKVGEMVKLGVLLGNLRKKTEVAMIPMTDGES
jgi:hypothetical protein